YIDICICIFLLSYRNHQQIDDESMLPKAQMW
ncbi:MAG: hypothetical protein ACI8ZZ_002006, partial [Gammaproteobacteria bacterium]